MGIVGVVHTVLGFLSLLLGLLIFCGVKGTQRHRMLGYAYVLSMLGLNLTGLMIYRVFGFFGPFHVLAIISLLALVKGFVPVYFKRPPDKWLEQHYEGMGWSYIGLVAAAVAEVAVRLPFVQGFGWVFGVVTAAASFLVTFVGAYLLYRYREDALAPFRRPPVGPQSPAE